MTLLSLVQNISKETGFGSPATVIGSSDATAIQMLALSNKGGKQLAKRGDGVKGFSILQTEHTFTTVSGTAEYALPSDYEWLLTDSLWDRTNAWKLSGPVSPQEWQQIKSGVLAGSTGPRRRVRIKRSATAEPVTSTKAFFVDPTPATTGDTLVFEYMSNAWCESSAGVNQSSWAADTDVGILDEYLLELQLKFMFLKAKGQEYGDDKHEFELELQQAIARDGGARIVNMGGPSELFLTANLPEAGFG